MSDLQQLLGGTATAAGENQQTDQQSKKRKPTPKPDRVVQREKATGTQAVWDENDNGGRGGWVIPGLSEKMGGPKGKKSGALSDTDVANAKAAAPTLENANEDFLRGGYQDASDKLDALVKADPKKADDPKYKKLRKHLDIELNM